MDEIEVHVPSSLRPLWTFESGHQKLLDTGSPIQGPVLAILAMLACKSTLRVAAGGTAPPNPLRCAPLAWAAPGRDGKAGSPIEQKSRFGSRRLGGSITTGKRF